MAATLAPAPMAPLPISEQVVHEVLLARGTIAAAELVEVFAPRDDAERLQLTRCISHIAEVLPASAWEEPLVRLRSAAAMAAPATKSRGPPLPIEPMAVRTLLLAQAQQAMPAAEFQARFAPRSEEERQCLAGLIADIAELATSPTGESRICLKAAEQRPPRAPPPVAAGDDGYQVTAMERDLVRKVLSSCQGGTIRTDELVRRLAPGDRTAKRRLARVLAEVARAVEQPDGCGGTAAYLVLRDENMHENSLPGGSATEPDHSGRSRHRSRRHCASNLTDASRATTAAASVLSQGSSASSSCWGSSDVRGYPAAEVVLGPSAAGPPLPPIRTPGPTVTEYLVYETLRARGGRMLSTELISAFQPMDAAGRRALAGIVQRIGKTVLTDVRDSAATIVLRETLLRERVEDRAATVIQLTQRRRRDDLSVAVSAGIAIQAAARRRLAFREACARWLARRAACTIQDYARRWKLNRLLHQARLQVRSASRLQTASRRWLVGRRIKERVERRQAAATSLQAAQRRQVAARAVAVLRREAIMARETPEERAAREATERTSLLRDKLRRRKRLERRQPASQEIAPEPEPPHEYVTMAQPPVQHVPDPEPARERPELREEGEGEGIDAMMSRIHRQAQGTGDEALTNTAHGQHQEGDGSAPMGSGLMPQEEDFLAAMREMMRAHGGDDNVDNDDDV